jgi:hypothetical protein
MAAGRGALLLAVAVAVGVVLLNAADSTPSPQQVVSNQSQSTLSTVAELSTTTLPARAPKDVKVIAANGTRVKGAGAKVTDTLRQAGYDVLSPTDAPKANASMAYFVTGYDRDAAEVARALGLSPTAIAPMPAPPPIGDVRGAHVVVVIGPDLAGGTGETTATTRAAATTTTRKPTTTTAKAGTTTTAKGNTTTTRKATTTTDAPG